MTQQNRPEIFLGPSSVYGSENQQKLVVVGHYFIWHAQVLTDVYTGAVVSGQQVTVKGEHMNAAQKSVMVLCQQVDRSPG